MTYTCARCGEEFESDWSREDAEAQAIEVFGRLPTKEAVLCDDCYASFIEWAIEQGLVRSRG